MSSFHKLSNIEYQKIDLFPKENTEFTPSFEDRKLTLDEELNRRVPCPTRGKGLSPDLPYRVQSPSASSVTSMVADSSCISSPVSPDSVAPSRKNSTKPLAEKRRRQRINQCVENLKTMILQALKKDPTHYTKLEKADILEMTVRYVQDLQKQQQSRQNESKIMYQAGFTRCSGEIDNYLDQCENISYDVRARLSNHLRDKGGQIQTGNNENSDKMYVKIAPAVQPVLLVINPLQTTMTPVQTTMRFNQNQRTSVQRVQLDQAKQTIYSPNKDTECYVSSTLQDDSSPINPSAESNTDEGFSSSSNSGHSPDYGRGSISPDPDIGFPAYEAENEDFENTLLDPLNLNDKTPNMYEEQTMEKSPLRPRKSGKSVIEFASKYSEDNNSDSLSQSSKSREAEMRDCRSNQKKTSSKNKAYKSRLTAKHNEHHNQIIQFMPQMNRPREDLQNGGPMWRPWH